MLWTGYRGFLSCTFKATDSRTRVSPGKSRQSLPPVGASNHWAEKGSTGMFPAIAPQMRRKKIRLGAGPAPRLALANGRLLGSSKAHHERVDRPVLAVNRRGPAESNRLARVPTLRTDWDPLASRYASMTLRRSGASAEAPPSTKRAAPLESSSTLSSG